MVGLRHCHNHVLGVQSPIHHTTFMKALDDSIRLGTRVALIKYLGQNKKVTSYILHFVGNFSNTFQVGLLSFYKKDTYMNPIITVRQLKIN